MKTRFVLGMVALAVAAAGLSIAPAGLEAAGAGQAPAARGSMPMPQAGMADMMKMHEQMMADMKAADARLDTLAKAMNAATGAGKIDAVAAVVNELVTQHQAMRMHLDGMDQMMMGGRGGMSPR